MQNRSLGILVFPTHRSDIILGNPSLLHYGSHNKNDSTGNRNSHYPEKRSQDSRNSSDPTGNNLSLYHHFSNTNTIIATEKVSQSMESNQQCSRANIDQQRIKADKKEEQNLLKEQKTLIHQIGNPTKNVPGIAICNESKYKSNEKKMITITENEPIGWKLSNLPDGSEPSKISEVTITSTSLNSSSNIRKGSYVMDVQPNLQDHNFTYSSKSLSPSSTIQAKQKLIEAIIQRRSMAGNNQYMSDFFFFFFLTFTIFASYQYI